MTVFVEKIAKWTAVLGGLVLVGLIVLAVISIVGRSINTVAFLPEVVEFAPFLGGVVEGIGIRGVTGDFEMIEVGVAFAIFSFLPYCQLRGGHASVDIFTSFLPRKANHFLIAFWDIVLAGVIMLICWRLYEGMMGKMSAHETSMLLQIPVWWAYCLSFLASLVSVFVGVYIMIVRFLEILTGHKYMPESEGASH
ncbi:TRAP transporter small permease [Terasakiella pusilla]|uniref:TRAP transporter small permease n=1 Tax=Terasakiella pusilla TaxID=64973 RepID=UPI000490B833|nr:TRAP transporter small permease [Terasakiella pusilla]